MDEADYLWSTRADLLFRVRLSTLYHQKRERFFELLDKCVKAVSVIGGSAALSRLTTPNVLLAIAATITATSTLALVFSFSERSKRHAELARTFRNLEGEIVAAGERDYKESDLSEWTAKERSLESSEPPALGMLVVACHNELSVALGHRDRVVSIPFVKRLTMNFVDWHVTG